MQNRTPEMDMMRTIIALLSGTVSSFLLKELDPSSFPYLAHHGNALMLLQPLNEELLPEATKADYCFNPQKSVCVCVFLFWIYSCKSQIQ